MSIIPNINSNNYNQKIKIQITNNNECIIKTLDDESINKIDTKNNNSITNNSFYYNNNNDFMNLSKSVSSSIFNQNSKINNPESNRNHNEKESISNLLISFSSISEISKTNNNDNVSKTNNNILSNKKIKNKKLEIPPCSTPTNKNKDNSRMKNDQNNVNKCNLNSLFSDFDKENSKSITKLDQISIEEKTNNDFVSFNNNDLNEISIGAISLNVNDKSENYDKVNIIGNSENKNFNTSNNLNSTITANKNNVSSSKKHLSKNSEENTEKSTRNKNSNGKIFKNCIIENIENLNIIQKNNKSIKYHKYNMPEQIEPKHCVNFSFEGIPLNSKIYHNNNNFEINLIEKNNTDNNIKNNSPENLNIIINSNKKSVINCNNIEINKYFQGPFKHDIKKKNENIKYTNVKIINEDIRNTLLAMNNIKTNKNQNLNCNNNVTNLSRHTINTFYNGNKKFQTNVKNKEIKKNSYNGEKTNSNHKQINSSRKVKSLQNEKNPKKRPKISTKCIVRSENSEEPKSILHNKTKSGSGVMNNNRNKNGCEFIKKLKKKLVNKCDYNFKKFKSISPKNEHQSLNKTQKTKNNYFSLNKNSAIKDKKDIILSKNIISLNKTKHKSLSPQRKLSNNKNNSGKKNSNNIKCINNNSNSYRVKNDKTKIIFPNSVKRNANKNCELSASRNNSKSKNSGIKKNKKQIIKNNNKNLNLQNNLLIQENFTKSNYKKKQTKLINKNHITILTNKKINNANSNNVNSNNNRVLISGNSLVLNNIINANKNTNCNNTINTRTKNMNLLSNTKYNNTSINNDSKTNTTNSFYNNIDKIFFSESSLKKRKLNESNNNENNLISSFARRLDPNENTNTKAQHVEVIHDFSKYKKICKVINVNRTKDLKDNNIITVENTEKSERK